MQDYAWSTGENTQGIIATNTGMHYVTITDTSGCTAEDSIMLLFLAEPSVDLGADTVYCAGDSVVLDAGTAQEYAWSNGDSTQTTAIYGW